MADSLLPEPPRSESAGPERPLRAGSAGPERPLRAGSAGPERPLRAGSAGPPWLEHVGRWRDALPQPTWARVAAAVVAVIVMGVVVLFLTRKPAAPPLVLPRAAPEGGSGASAAEPPTSQAAGPVTVHAAGAVARPGVYVVPAGARVADVVSAAGGTLPDAEVDQVNLAAKVADAERVYIPRKGEAPPVPPAGNAGAGGTTAPAGPVDLNTATAEQLDTLPGVGPSTAQAILQFRSSHGRFKSVDDLLDVRGIGPAKLEALRPMVRVR